jgi:radical SAM/Cys-rich protein
MRDTRSLLLETDFPDLRRQSVTTLQVNLGYRCNLSCVHCHVNAGPSRTEEMSGATVDTLLRLIDVLSPTTLDLTGGAPEMNPHFKRLVVAARERDMEVIDRCNLTILFEPEQAGLAEFLAEQGVTVSASLPCYQEQNVELQRGKGVYADSIRALQCLNELGYGRDPRLQLHLVYNPVGPVLPPPQQSLEADYKRELAAQHGVIFNELLTITNMPIARFGAVLLANDEYTAYMRLLRENFSADNLETVMCRHLVSVDWQGFLYDCDFNQMLAMPVIGSDRRLHLDDLLDDPELLQHRAIVTGEHCYGCTAGQGSSCGGALER